MRAHIERRHTEKFQGSTSVVNHPMVMPVPQPPGMSLVEKDELQKDLKSINMRLQATEAQLKSEREERERLITEVSNRI